MYHAVYTSVSESVCGDVQVARDLGMPVMLPSWVDHCWTAGLDSCISALDSDIVRPQYTMEIFPFFHKNSSHLSNKDVMHALFGRVCL